MGSSLEDPVVREVTITVREWHKIWLSLYLDNQVKLFDEITTLITTIIELRTQLINLIKQNATSQYINNHMQQINELKKDIVNRLDHGNRLLNLDLIPRDKSFSLVDPVAMSPIELYQLHTAASNNIDNSNNVKVGTVPDLSINNSSSVNSQSNNTSSRPLKIPLHLMMTITGHSLNGLPPDDLVELHFSIIDSTNNINNGGLVNCGNTPATNINSSNLMIQPLTEKFIIQLQQDEITNGVNRTIFLNLCQSSHTDICLYVQVYRIGKMTLMDNKTAFSKQQSTHNLYVSVQDGSMNSINSVTKYAPNGLSRSRHSSIILPETPPIYKRPFGATILSLKELTQNLNPCEKGVWVKIPLANESEFSQVSELYSKRHNNFKINPNLPNVQLELSVRFLSCNQEMLPEIVCNSQPCSLTEKRGFPDYIMSGDFKNDLFITLESAEFEKGGKSISKNIEASISLIDKTGLVIDGCISPGSNCDNISCYRSCVFYHSNSPKWYESLKINVPLSQFDTAHIRIEFRHCSTKEKEKKFLGFAFLPLSDEDGTIIADNSHELYIYKCDSQIYDDESLNLSKYTSLPYGPLAKNNTKSSSQLLGSTNNSFTHSHREIVTINTYLLSTKLTQNRDLLNLLRWRELVKRDNNEFEEALKRVSTLKGDEIVKFLQDILDTLFDTFTIYSTSEDDYSALIFKVLVHIFLLLEEPEYQHFKPVLNTYVSNHFSATLVYKGLLACIKKCLDYLVNLELHGPIQKCFRSIEYVFQFIVQSRLLYAKATGDLQDDLFLNDLRQLFQLFEAMLSSENANLIPIQVTFLEHFPKALEQLVKVMSSKELAQWVISLAGSVGFKLPPALARAKLIYLRETVNCGLIKTQDVRMLIIETFCRHIDQYLIRSHELELCNDVLEIMINKIHNYHWPSIHRLYTLTYKSNLQQQQLIYESISCPPATTVGEINLNIISNTLITNGNLKIPSTQLELSIDSLSKELEPLINLLNSLLALLGRLLKEHGIESIIVQKYSNCLLTILKLMSKNGFELFMKKRQIDYPKLCSILRSSRSMYYRDWSLMQLTSHSILEHPIREIFRDIQTKSDSYPINRQLTNYINLIVEYITLPSLQLESFSDQKRDYILNIFGDLRMKYATQLVKFWSDLPEKIISDLIPTTIQPFFDVSLLPNKNLQNLIVPIFYDMIDADKSNSRQFERCLIDNIDMFFNLDRGSVQFMENFGNILNDKLRDKSPTWKIRGQRMIMSLTNLMRLLIEYRQSLENCEIQSKKMHCLVELCNFYKEDRFDLHVRYLYKLCDMHLKSGNYVEAAFTLKQYSDELRWYKNTTDKCRQEEQEWKRKEALYHRIINYFDEGKCWEEAIPLCKELSSIYENFLVDFEKWSQILRRLAKFADNILHEHRPEIEYFRIEFFGADLPNFVRDKEFIYRAGGYERLPSFIARMSSEFPDVTTLNFKTKQTVTKGCPGQYMFISTIKPVPILQDNQRDISDKVIKYYLNNRLDTFSYDIPIIKSPPNNNNESNVNNNNSTNQDSSTNKDKSVPSTPETSVRNLWVGRYILKTKKQLPDILPWSEVVSHDYIELNPIENAIETIKTMNVELTKLILSFKNEPNKQIRPLTMRLQGVIEAPVNGGPSVFINAFLKHRSPCSENKNSMIEIESLKKLRDVLKQQFSILEAGLAIHGKLASPEMMPLHSMLVDRLKELVKPFNETNNSIYQFPLDGA